MSVAYIDFETRSACDLKRAGSHVYAAHPSTDILCLGIAFDDGPVEMWKRGDPRPFDLLSHIEEGGIVVGHNIGGFEMPIWRNICEKRFGWPPLKIEQCRDTMAYAYAMSLPASLEKAAAAMGISEQKDLAGSRVMMQLAKPRDAKPMPCAKCRYSDLAKVRLCDIPNDQHEQETIWWEDATKFEKLYAYCAQDVEVERELYKRLMPLSDAEQAVWELDYKINNRGVQVDVKAATAALSLVEFEKKRLNDEMRKLTDNRVATCTATVQLSEWLRSEGVEVDGVAKADVLVLLELDLPRVCRDALLLRQEAAKSSTAKLDLMVESTGADGRTRGLFQYHGAGTGRWAGRRIQLQNLPRPKLKQSEIEEVFQILGAVK